MSIEHEGENGPPDEDEVRSTRRLIEEMRSRERAADVNFSAIQAFVAAASHRTLADAARSCGVEESTFRKRIEALEKYLGCILFQTRPTFTITPDGADFLEDARAICLIMKRKREELTFWDICQISGRNPKEETQHTIRALYYSSGVTYEID